jgi:hypothetical protein
VAGIWEKVTITGFLRRRLKAKQRRNCHRRVAANTAVEFSLTRTKRKSTCVLCDDPRRSRLVPGWFRPPRLQEFVNKHASTCVLCDDPRRSRLVPGWFRPPRLQEFVNKHANFGRQMSA